MLSKHDIWSAIEELTGKSDHNYADCQKLLTFSLLNLLLYGEATDQFKRTLFDATREFVPEVYNTSYSGENKPVSEFFDNVIQTDGSSEFKAKINGKSVDELIDLMDDLVSDTLYFTDNALYNSVMRKLDE